MHQPYYVLYVIYNYVTLRCTIINSDFLPVIVISKNQNDLYVRLFEKESVSIESYKYTFSGVFL